MRKRKNQARTDVLLSSYLDGKLPPGEQAKLEERLERDADLRRQLKSMRQTVAMVKSLPRVEAPRNFLLAPSMVEVATKKHERPRMSIVDRWLAPALSFATAVSALLLVVTLASGLLMGQAGEDQLAAPAPTVALEVAEAPEEPEAMEAPPDATPEAMLAAPTPEPEGSPAADEEVPAEEAAGESELAPTEALTTTEPVGGGASPPTPPPTATATVEAEEPAPPNEESEGLPAEGIAPATEAVRIEEVEEEEEIPVPPPEAPPEAARWVLPVALALLTLVLIAATIVAWRARKTS